MSNINNIVKKALEQDNTIVTSRDKLDECKGFTTEYMAFLGLNKNVLKKLERNGLAVRGYSNKATQTKLGRQVSGHKPMWVLLGDSNG